MRTWWRLTCRECGQAVLSLRFALTAAAMAALLLVSSAWYINGQMDLISMLWLSMSGGTGASLAVLCILPLFPYAMRYAQEVQSGAASYIIIRAGVLRYACAKAAAVFLSGAAVTALGLSLFLLCAVTVCPLFNSLSSAMGYAEPLDAGRPLLHILCVLLHHGMTGGMMACLALCVSAAIPSGYVALSMPVVLYLLALRAAPSGPSPHWLSPTCLVQVVYDTGTAAGTLLVKAGVTAALCLLLCAGTHAMMQRRLRRA